MRIHTLLPLSFIALAAAGAAFVPYSEDVKQTAGADVPQGVLSFRVSDEAGVSIPCRLTFFRAGEEDETPALFPGVDAAQGELAVRENVIYSLSGSARISVPAGDYKVYATRGIEWSRADALLTIEEGKQVAWNPTLRHEVDTTGWISADLHLHTLTHSGHGDSNLPERIVSLVGEGVELAAATDHNHNTDYDPTISEVGAGERITAIIGNEVSTSIGHFNVYPLAPSRPVIDSSLTDANELFERMHMEPNPFGVMPIIQLNHPRWEGIDYFAQTGFDPVTGTSDDASFSLNFDCLEVLNENVGWGYFEKHVEGVATDANLHSVLEDWFHLLDRGHRSAAVGNSDSHTVHYAFAGYPRNLIQTGSDDPGNIDPAALASAIRGGRVVATSGPVLEVRAGDVAMGGTIAAEKGRIRMSIEVQSASWIACDRLEVVVNGDRIQTIELPETNGPLHAIYEIELALDLDAWVVVLAEGDTPLSPIVPTRKGRPAYPIAIANPIRVDADGDGEWTAPMDSAKRAVEELASADEAMTILGGHYHLSKLSPPEAVRWILASIELDVLPVLGLAGLASKDRAVQLAGARAFEKFVLRESDMSSSDRSQALLQLSNAYWWVADDPYLEVTLLRDVIAADTSGTIPLGEYFQRLDERYGSEVVAPYMSMLESELKGAGAPVVAWSVMGYFDAPLQGTIRETHLGPERSFDPAATYPGRTGEDEVWVDLDAAEDGHVDLRRLASEGESSENCFAYAQTWLYSSEARDVLVGLGTDDGGRVYVNGDLFHEDLDRQGASPLQHVKSMPLNAGWNRVLFQVENGGGAYGLYLHMLEPDVHSARAPGF